MLQFTCKSTNRFSISWKVFLSCWFCNWNCSTCCSSKLRSFCSFASFSADCTWAFSNALASSSRAACSWAIRCFKSLICWVASQYFWLASCRRSWWMLQFTCKSTNRFSISWKVFLSCWFCNWSCSTCCSSKLRSFCSFASFSADCTWAFSNALASSFRAVCSWAIRCFNSLICWVASRYFWLALVSLVCTKFNSSCMFRSIWKKAFSNCSTCNWVNVISVGFKNASLREATMPNHLPNISIFCISKCWLIILNGSSK